MLFFASFTADAIVFEADNGPVLEVYVNIVKPPECTLTSAKNQTINFAPLSNIDIVLGNDKTKGTNEAVFTFGQCRNVNNVDIKFVPPSAGAGIDETGNYIKNATASGSGTMAEGVGIKLFDITNNATYNNSNEIKLGPGDGKGLAVTPVNDTATVKLGAKVIPTDNNYRITPGEIKTAVGLEITYK